MKNSSILHNIQRPLRYLGGEVGQVVKDPAETRTRFALCFPDIYEIGMSHAGIRILYSILNGMDGVWAQRVFAPWPDMVEALTRHDLPLYSLEEQRPLHDFDLVGFSLMYELCYSTVVRMLKLGGIPVLSADRGTHDPIVIAGGTATTNPAPFAPFFDLVCIGDGEDMMRELAAISLETTDRDERLNAMEQVEGVWRPGSSRTPGRRILADLDSHPFPSATIVPHAGIVHDRLGVEVARGCTRGCRFCQAGMIYRPYRERSFDSVRETFQQGLTNTGYDEISLLALSVTDLSYLEALMQTLSCPSRQISMGIPSMRVEGMSNEFARSIAEVKKAGFTMAPEAATERLRAVINKGNTEEDLLRSVQTIRKMGWRLLKLYFMIGLPTETPEDITAIIDLTKEVTRQFRGRINVSISAFNPKPWTPFQWERQISMDEHREILARLQHTIRDRNNALKWHEPQMSYLEGIFARGDEHLAPVIRRAAEKGAYLDAWGDCFDLAPWMEAFAECGVDPDHYLEARDTDTPLPWEFIDMHLDRDFLLQERQRAHAASQTPDCRFTKCASCGACQNGTHNVIRGNNEPSPLFTEIATETARSCVLELTKEGPLALLSPPNWAEMIKRSIRRAQLPAVYSRGFSPAMKLSTTAPPSFGIASQSEFCRFELTEPLATEEIRHRLAPQLPEGCRIVSIAEGKLPRIAAAVYQLTGPARLELPEDATITKTTKKGATRTLKVADYLEEYDGTRLRLAYHEGVTISPLLLLETFGTEEISPDHIIREKLIQEED